MDLQISTFLFVILSLFGRSTFGIQIVGNGYTGVFFAINPAVRENPALLKSIEDMVKRASPYLYQAIGNRFYFKEVTILVPPNWSKGSYGNATTETYSKANIIIDEPNGAYGDEPYTLQYGQCGEQGQYIHLTPNFLLDDKLIDIFGERSRVFLHEWAHLRWGVYDEYSEEQPFYLSGTGQVEATRCAIDINGRRCVMSGDHCMPCNNDASTGLPTSDCRFIPYKHSSALTSMMSFPSLESVIEYCSDITHNAEAPNRQNDRCANRATLDVILNSSVDRGVLPSAQAILPPIFRVVRRTNRVVCLTLDTSGSMLGSRLMHLQQAASLFLREIIEDRALVAIVEFNSVPTIKKPLTMIDGQSREELVSALPNRAIGSTSMCQGITIAIQVLNASDHSTLGDEIIVFTDGEATDDLTTCLQKVRESGVIVHAIALGPQADNTLSVMADETGGDFFQTPDNLESNALLDAFASLTSSDGNLLQQTIQLESSGSKISDWFNGTFSVDRTVGNGTVATIVYEATPPRISIRSPNGENFNQSHFKHDEHLRTLSLKIPGTAKTGEWHYSLLNEFPNPQVMSTTVTSRASSEDVPPIIVKAHMDQKSTNGSKAMVVYAAVTQKGLPVILADVTAVIESSTGQRKELELLDNGAGADAYKHDGIYSRYFIDLETGRFSLKVKVQSHGKAMISTHRHNGVPYVHGYVLDAGRVQLNPPQPPVNNQPVEVGSFSRTATGESFVVDLPSGYTPAFPPCKITDLKASLEGDNVTLTWTAPGERYDQGTAMLYNIHWSKDVQLLRRDFEKAQVVSTLALSPQEAGSIEKHSFLPYNFNMTNGTAIYFAITTENAYSLKSVMSNIAHVVKFEPQPQHTNVIAIAVCSTVAVIVMIIALIINI